MTKWRLSVCKGPDCRANGSQPVWEKAKELINGKLEDRCDLFRGGCYGLCHLGPNVIIRPDPGKPLDPLSSEDFQLQFTPGETYYWQMTAEKMERVVKEHVVGGKEVQDLVGDHTKEEDLRFRG
ncbi:MAG: (2Fe-2S) ferredoxin domain-containing protein [Myxococcaceae bacterium]